MTDRELMQQALDALNHVNAQDRVEVIAALHKRLAQPDTDKIRPSSDQAAMVNPRVLWIPVRKEPPPLGKRLLLINRAQGMTVVGEYQGRFGHDYWQAHPVFPD